MKNIQRLANLISSWARKGAKLADHGRMCDECAFRKGSVAQSEPHNVNAAASCLAYYGAFNCHKNGYEDAGKPCAGFLYAKEYREHVDSQTVHNQGGEANVDKS